MILILTIMVVLMVVLSLDSWVNLDNVDLDDDGLDDNVGLGD